MIDTIIVDLGEVYVTELIGIEKRLGSALGL